MIKQYKFPNDIKGIVYVNITDYSVEFCNILGNIFSFRICWTSRSSKTSIECTCKYRNTTLESTSLIIDELIDSCVVKTDQEYYDKKFIKYKFPENLVRPTILEVPIIQRSNNNKIYRVYFTNDDPIEINFCQNNNEIKMYINESSKLLSLPKYYF